MSNDFASALRDEIAALESALSLDPRVAKLRELKRIAAQFYHDSQADSNGRGSQRPNPLMAGTKNATTSRRRASPERDRILEEAERLVRESAGGPVPTKAVFAALQESGIDIPGNKPINYVSAVLSTSGRLVANGRRGWTMRTEGNFEHVEDKGEVSDEAEDHAPSPDELRDAALEREADERSEASVNLDGFG